MNHVSHTIFCREREYRQEQESTEQQHMENTRQYNNIVKALKDRVCSDLATFSHEFSSNK